MKAWKTTSGTPSWEASSIVASMCSQPEWTPPSETRPSRCRRPARAAAGALAGGEQRLVLEEAAVGDRVVDPRQVLLDDRPGAEVEVADLGVAHLPVGQADVAALGGELGVGEAAPEAVEDRRLGERDRVARAGLGQAPAVEDDERQRGDSARSTGRLDDRGEVGRVEAGAADQRAVDVGLSQQLGGVAGLDRAAVEDAHRIGVAAALAQQRRG